MQTNVDEANLSMRRNNLMRTRARMLIQNKEEVIDLVMVEVVVHSLVSALIVESLDISPLGILRRRLITIR